MQVASMTSQVQSIRSLIAQVSGLIGLIVFLNQAWSFAPLERTILTAFGAGLAVYVVLVLGYATAQRILAYSPPEEEAGADADDEDVITDEAAAEAPEDATSDAPPTSKTSPASATTATEAATPQRQAA